MEKKEMKKWGREEEEWKPATWWGPQIEGFEVSSFLFFFKVKI